MSDKKFHHKKGLRNPEGPELQSRTAQALGPAGIPRLELDSDLTHWKTGLKNFVTIAKYSTEINDLIEFGRAPAIPQLQQTEEDYAKVAKSPLALMAFEAQFKTQIAEREKKVSRVKDDMERFYILIWDQVGIQIQNACSLETKFAERRDQKNSMWLLKTVTSIHQGGAQVSQEDACAMAIVNFSGMKHRKYESIHAFDRRRAEEYLAYREAGGPDLSEEVQIVMFNKALNKSYAPYVSYIQNQKSMKRDVPRSLVENYQAAAKYVSNVSDAQTDSHQAVFFNGEQRQLAAQRKAATAATTKDSKSKVQATATKARRNDWIKTATCNGCGEIGHLVRTCPFVISADDDAEEFDDAVEDDGSKVNAAIARVVGLAGRVPPQFLIGLDGGAYTSVFRCADFISDISYDTCEPLLDWHGNRIQNAAHGMLHPFGYVEINELAPINLLSEYELKTRFDFDEVPLVSLSVYACGTTIDFYMDHDRHMFVVDWREYVGIFTYSPVPRQVGVVINSVRQNEALYSKREVQLAKEARKTIANLGFASKEDVQRLAVSSGNVVNLNLNRADVLRAIEIYGEQNVLMGRSRLVTPDTRVIKAVPQLKRPQALFTDMFYIGDIQFLLCCAKPLDVIFVKVQPHKTESDYGASFEEFVSILRSFGFGTEIIYSDADPAVIANINDHGPLRVETCAAGDHIEEAEARIKTVKERFRSVKSSVNFPLSKKLIIELVAFVVGRINISISQYANDGLCPRVRLTSELVDAKKDLRIGFGSYVLARNKNVKSNDALALRCEACITLRPVGNRQGSWRMLKLINGRIVSRSQFKEQPITDDAMARLEELALQESKGNLSIIDDELEYEDLYDEFLPMLDETLDDDIMISFPPNSAPFDPGFVIVPAEHVDNSLAEKDSTPPPLVDDIDSDDDDDDAADSDDDEEAASELKRDASRYTNKSRKRWNKTNSFAGIGLFHISPKAGFRKYKGAAFKSQYKEIKSLLDNGTFEGVIPGSLSKNQRKKVIRTIMFLKEKYAADGSFEKLKARLVANGSQMDRDKSKDVSSPTVSLIALLVISTLAAREGREIATMDVGSAFVKASMEGEDEVFVVLDQLSAALLIQIDPSYEKYLDDKGEMTVKLKKALYGCLQSARLWHNLLISELRGCGYTQNVFEPCVLNKTVDGKQCTLLVHVDDIKVASLIPGEIDRVHSVLVAKFGAVSLNKGLKHNYVGMTFDYSIKGQVVITMLGYEQDLVKEWTDATVNKKFDANGATAASPAVNNIFEKGNSDPLSTNERKLFHTFTMKLAYLGKRVKPELNVSTSYLSTQVTCPNADDLIKLDRAIRYVRDNTGTGIVLKAAGEFKNVMITGHIDASFGCHSNGKSHTGVYITLGEGPVFVRSVKQKIVTKSSTEAELVALSDEAGTVFSVIDFVKAQGYRVKSVYGQDNTSTITMITGGKNDSMRTKHINVRYFWLRERFQQKELNIVHVPTGLMIADVLTKPMQGTMFRRFVQLLCNRSQASPAVANINLPSRGCVNGSAVAPRATPVKRLSVKFTDDK